MAAREARDHLAGDVSLPDWERVCIDGHVIFCRMRHALDGPLGQSIEPPPAAKPPAAKPLAVACASSARSVFHVTPPPDNRARADGNGSIGAQSLALPDYQEPLGASRGATQVCARGNGAHACGAATLPLKRPGPAGETIDWSPESARKFLKIARDADRRVAAAHGRPPSACS